MSDSRVWIITGTSSGIGRALITEVIAAGERVAATTRKATSISELSATYSPDKLLVVEYDVGNPTYSAETLFDKIHDHFGRIDVVVNNAGYGLSSIVEGTSDEDARYQFEVNFWGAVRISREAVKYFREHKTPAGRIINISSMAGFSSFPNFTLYSASKFALEGFGEGLHKELLPEWNIKIITVQPGGVATQWTRGNMIIRDLPPAYDSPGSPANKMRDLIHSTPSFGDVVKLSRGLVAISRVANPPLRLPMGSDAQHVVLTRLEEIKKEIEEWDELTLSAVVDGADPLFFKKLREMQG